MTRPTRIALFAALALLIAAAGSVVATRLPPVATEPAGVTSTVEGEAGGDRGDADDAEDTAGDGDGAARARERLAEAGIEVDQAAFDDLAARYGVGGAVRLFAWSDATGRPVEELAAMRDDDGTGEPMGWGRMAKDLGVHPGIGRIMGNGRDE